MIGAVASYANIEIDEAASLNCTCEGQEQQVIILIAYGDAESFTFQWEEPNGLENAIIHPSECDVTDGGMHFLTESVSGNV